MMKRRNVGVSVLIAIVFVFLPFIGLSTVACQVPAPAERPSLDADRGPIANAPTITITKPNGGEKWAVGNGGEIKWTATGYGTVTIDLEYSVNGASGNFKTIKTGVGNTGTYYWTIPNDPSTDCYARGTIHDQNGTTANDVSDANFTIFIAPLVVWLKDPHGGENYEVSQFYFINWTASGGVPPRKMDLEYSTAGSSGPWKTIVTGTNDVGGYSWSVPNDPSTDAYVRITAHDSGSQTDQAKNNASFNIVMPPPPSITITAPNGGENWTAGKSYDITWDSKGKYNKMNVSYSTAGPSGPWTLITDQAVNIGVYSWQVANTPTTTAYVKVFAKDVFGRLAEDANNAAFTISAAPFMVTVDSPVPGDNWLVGSMQTVSWTITGGTSPYSTNLDYSPVGKGGPWKSIATGISSATYTWTVPDDPSTTAVMRATVTDSKSATTSGMNAGSFVISLPKPTVNVIKPNGGETLTTGTHYSIQWSASGGVGTLSANVSYSTSGWNGQYTDIANDLKGQSSYDWIVPAEDTIQAFVKVVVTDGRSYVEDTSEKAFTITTSGGSGGVKLLTPNGGETWDVFTEHNITWKTSGDGTYTINLKFSTAGKSGPWASIQQGLQDTGSYKWKVPDTGATSTECYVLVESRDTSTGATASDTNDKKFTIHREAVISGIKGTVLDDSNGTALQDATVEIVETGDYSVTDEYGAYLIPYLPAGAYTLKASRPGYNSHSEKVTMNAGELKTININLKSAIPTGSERNAFVAIIADNWQMILLLIILIVVLMAIIGTMAKRRASAPGRCKRCKMPVPPKQKLCAMCADAQGLVICPKCKKMLPKGVTWCTACSEILPGTAPTQGSGEGSSVVTVTIPSKCPGCDKQVEVGNKAVRCTCGAFYHKECSDSVEICRKCKRRVKLA